MQVRDGLYTARQYEMIQAISDFFAVMLQTHLQPFNVLFFNGQPTTDRAIHMKGQRLRPGFMGEAPYLAAMMGGWPERSTCTGIRKTWLRACSVSTSLGRPWQ